jgi:hypothetical protein
MQIGLLVTAITVIVCFLGVRPELKSAKDPIVTEHRLTVSSDERRVDMPIP